MAYKVKKGAHYIDALNSRWIHVACFLHRDDHEEGDGSGHQPNCPGCVETARDTVAHIQMVENNSA